MFKTIMATALLSLSLSSFAAIELRSIVSSESCTIKGDKVTKTTSMLYGELKFSTMGTVKIEGLEKIARRAADATTDVPNEYFTHELVLDGQTYRLNTTDSTESMALVNMMSRICKFF